MGRIEGAKIPIITSIGRDKSVILTTEKLLTEYDSSKIAVVGCATGEQVFSLAETLSTERPEKLQIDGYDIDEKAIKQANEGIVSSLVPDDHNRKFATALVEKIKANGTTFGENSFRVSDKLRALVSFTRHNILHEPLPDIYDIIVCTNLLSYFASQMFQTNRTNLAEAVYNIEQSLIPSGFLITEGFNGDPSLYSHPDHFMAKYAQYMRGNPLLRLVSELAVPIGLPFPSNTDTTAKQSIIEVERANVYVKRV